MIKSTKKEPAANTVGSRVKEKNFMSNYSTKAIKRFDVKTNDEVVGPIYQTYDYKKFKFSEVNRKISTKHVKEIVKAIKNNDVALPIIQVNPQLEIIDGQHRFTALRSLGLPVYYYIDRNLTSNSIVEINSRQVRWGIRQFINARTKQGCPGFQELSIFIDRYKTVAPISSIAAIFAGESEISGSVTHQIQKGNYVFADRKKAIKFLDSLAKQEEKMAINKKISNRVAMALWRFYKQKGVNGKRLINLLDNEFLEKMPNDKNSLMVFIGRQYNNHLRKNVINFYQDESGKFHFDD